MTETSGFLSASEDENVYSQLEWLESIRDFRKNGIVEGGSYNTFEVTAQAAPDMTVKVDTGEAWIQGNHYTSTAAQNITIETADPVYPRYDRIVLRNYITGSRSIDVIAITGTPAPFPPALPAIIRTDDIYDLILARVTVGAGVTSITTGDILDRRSLEIQCGEALPTYTRVSDIIPGTEWDIAGVNLTNVGVCTADNDAATYDYIETIEIPAGYICAYAGSVVPSGWLECNGTVFDDEEYPDLYAQLGSTTLPDLRGRTPMGYKSTDADFDTVGETGGEDTHVLTTDEIPTHSHTGGITYTPGKTETSVHLGYCGSSASATGSTGSGTAHENRPPYMVLKWIIKAVTS